MNFELLHNGKLINDSIDISQCFSFDRYGGMLDDLTITFASDSNKIEFYEGDEIEIKTAGGFTTGVMYLDSCISNDGKTTITAISCRHKNKKKKSKIWNHPRLFKIIGDIANNTGLTPLLYGVEDFSYASVAQIVEPDLHFLARLCKREGYSVKCDNGNLIVFNENYLESNETPLPLSKSAFRSGSHFQRAVNGLSSVTVRYFDAETKRSIFYTSTDSEISGGEDIRIEFLSDFKEARRFSAGYLRDANKYHITGLLTMPFNGGISAGTVLDLTDFEEFDGRYVVYEAKQDFTLEKTTIKVRKVLNY